MLLRRYSFEVELQHSEPQHATASVTVPLASQDNPIRLGPDNVTLRGIDDQPLTLSA
jgi:hypothetical protein